MQALTSGRYHIKWTQLADLPVPLYSAYTAVQDKKVYVTAGDSPVKDAIHQVYVYSINTDQWSQLPPSGHYYGIPHIIGGRLAIIGGRLSATKKRTNKVSTFDEESQTWSSYYPDLLSVRSKPGVVSHLEYVIVAGGTRPTTKIDDTPVVQDDIEVFNWREYSHWRKVPIKLPKPMWGFIPTISDNHLFIVGYSDEGMTPQNYVYKIPVANIMTSFDQQQSRFSKLQQFMSSNKWLWTELTAADHRCTALVPSLTPPVVVGGENTTGTIPTADIRIYDNALKIGSLSFPRSRVAVAAVCNTAFVVIGGCTKGDNMAKTKLSSVTVVELGEFSLLH